MFGVLLSQVKFSQDLFVLLDVLFLKIVEEPAARPHKAKQPAARVKIFFMELKMRIFGMGIQELLLILLVCGVLFGANKLPELGKSLGKGIREFKKAMKEINDDGDDKKIESEKPKVS